MRLILGLTFIFGGHLWATKPNAFKEVDSVLAKYRAAPAIKAKVKKTVVHEVMNLENVSSGKFYFSKGKLRLDFTEPEKTSLVYDGKHVWFESRLEDKKIHVTKMRTNELKRSNSVLTALFEKKDVLRNFNLLKSERQKDLKVFSFEPKNKKAESEVTYLEVALKDKNIERITYKDSLENKVSFEFSDVAKGAVPAKTFTYKLPKNAELTEI